jgi:hypothetical protein
MIVDSFFRFVATCVNGLLNLIPNFNIPNLDMASDWISKCLSGVGYFLPTTAVVLFFTTVIGYHAYEVAEYWIKLLIKYVTRLL